MAASKLARSVYRVPRKGNSMAPLRAKKAQIADVDPDSMAWRSRRTSRSVARCLLDLARPATVVIRSKRSCCDSGTTQLQERAPAADLGCDPVERVLESMCWRIVRHESPPRVWPPGRCAWRRCRDVMLVPRGCRSAAIRRTGLISDPGVRRDPYTRRIGAADRIAEHRDITDQVTNACPTAVQIAGRHPSLFRPTSAIRASTRVRLDPDLPGPQSRLCRIGPALRCLGRGNSPFVQFGLFPLVDGTFRGAGGNRTPVHQLVDEPATTIPASRLTLPRRRVD